MSSDLQPSFIWICNIALGREVVFGASITACFCLIVIFSSTSVTPNYEHNAGTVHPTRSQNTTSVLLHLLELNCFTGPQNRSIGALQIAIFSCCNTKPCCGACCQMRSSRSHFFSGAARAASPKVLLVRNPTITVFILSLAAASTTGRMGKKGKIIESYQQGSSDMAQGPAMQTLLWCSLQVNRISHKHISSTNSSELVHTQLYFLALASAQCQVLYLII